MPKTTFKNLPIEKQQMIMEAAKKEFTRKTLKNASINQIIKDANIPRGSFYMYFEDIEDLYHYFLDQLNQIAYDYMGQLLKKNKGNLKFVFLDYFEHIIQVCSKEDQNLFHNIFCNMNMYIEANKKPPFETNHFASLFQEINTTNYREISKKHLFFVYHLFFKETMEAVLQVVHFHQTKDVVKKELEEKFSLFEEGIYKRGE